MTLGPVGFLGVGTIATAMVYGLRAAWPSLPLHLSPRSEATSLALAAADPLIRREASNAAVVEASRLVFVTVLPTQLDTLMRSLRFRADQTVVSCVAGTPLAEIEAFVSPACACRLVPLPMIARREGPLILYPAIGQVRELFAGQGDLIAASDEQAFSAYVAGSAAMSTILALEHAMVTWMTRRGASSEGAATYVGSLVRSLAETAVRTDVRAWPTLVGDHETPGGLNERVRRSLQDQGWFEMLGVAFDGLASLKRGDLGRENDA